MTESAYLTQQAEDARLAMAHTWEELKHSMLGAADVKQWTRQYPWVTVGAALAAGVAAGYLITPRDKDEFKEMWEKLKDKLSSHPDKDAVYVEANGKPAEVKREPSFLQSFLKEAMKGAIPMVTSMLGGAMGSGQAAQQHAGDGSDAGATG